MILNFKSRMQRAPISKDSDFLNQQGPTLELIRSIDWSTTSIGSQDAWPLSLRSALSICINSNFPIAIYWGSDLVLLYNEAWSPIPGNKHPWAFGKTAMEVWPEIWSAIEPQFQKAFTGVPGGSKDALLPMQRHGYTEECYFDFTFTPIYGESGKVEGIFNAVIETTYRVINERRAGVLQRLVEAIGGLPTLSSVFDETSQVLLDAKADIPFFFIYQVVNGEAVLISNPPSVKEPLKPWPLKEVIESGMPRVIENLDGYLESVPDGLWPEAPTQAIVFPIKGNDGQVLAIMVAGASSRRRIDKDYRSFYESISNLISSEIITLQSLAKERERAEALAQIDKAKTAFFSNISHEFRTPLTLMLSPLEEVLHDGQNLSTTQRENLETSYRNSLRLQKLVNTLLDFSRIEAGRMDAQLRPIDISAITKDLASSFRSAIESSGIKYSVVIPDAVRPVLADVDMWEKIVLNLLSNAFKYTVKGEIKIELREEGDFVFLSVSDSGIGISQDNLGKIFERFYRVNNVGGRSQEGTGIGLSLVRELVLLHHGEIAVQSKMGVGSTFTVKLPVKSAPAVKADGVNGPSMNRSRQAFVDEANKWSVPIADKKPEPDHEASNKPSIIVADDNSDMRDYIIRLLKDEYHIHEATNGEDAFTLALQIVPDLIISDIMMPKLDGFGFLKKLRSNFHTRSIPLIFLSARAGEEAKVEGIQAGADDYLVKPFSSKELVARVANQIATSNVRRRIEKEFFNLFTQSPAHIHVFRGPEHTVEFFHPLGKKTIGRDITGQKIREALPELAGQGFFELLDDVYESGNTVSIPQSKVVLPGDDGKPVERYFHITYLPWRDLHGEIQGVLQFSFDQTEEALANLKIKESEERFRVLSNSIPQFVWIADPAGQVEYMSDQWIQYSGTSTEEGRASFSKFIHEDDIGEVRKRWKASMETRQPWTAEFRLRNVKTGEYRWFFGHTVPLFDEKRNVIKWIGSSSDIHQQKAHSFELEGVVAERTSELVKLNNVLKSKNEELSRAQNFLQTVLDSSVELVAAFDTKLNFTFVNKRLSTMSTRTPEQLIGKNLLEVDPDFENTEGYQQLKKALQGETIHVEARRPNIDESLVFETFIIPLKQHGQVTGVVSMERDITTLINLASQLRESNEQLKRSNEDLQQFAHVTSHDLKEPVRKIKMYGNILATDFSQFLPEKGRDYLARIDKATSRISAMIDGVLQYSTIDIAEQFLQEIDINETIKSIVEDLEIPIKENLATVECKNLPRMKGYPTLIYQLFYNLVNNSLKFKRRDVAPMIMIYGAALSESEKKEIGADYFKISLEDNGIGFDQAYAERIFESFTRLNPKDKFEGTGLGLALCRKIVLRHQGVIRALGELNKGALFNIFFPKAILLKDL